MYRGRLFQDFDDGVTLVVFCDEQAIFARRYDRDQVDPCAKDIEYIMSRPDEWWTMDGNEINSFNNDADWQDVREIYDLSSHPLVTSAVNVDYGGSGWAHFILWEHVDFVPHDLVDAIRARLSGLFERDVDVFCSRLTSWGDFGHDDLVLYA